MSTEMNRMTTPNSQLTTSKTVLVSSSHEQFIPERMKKANLFVKTLGLFALILASSLGVMGQTITYSMKWNSVNGSYSGTSYTSQPFTIKFNNVPLSSITSGPNAGQYQANFLNGTGITISYGSLFSDVPVDNSSINTCAIAAGTGGIYFGASTGTSYAGDKGSLSGFNPNPTPYDKFHTSWSSNASSALTYQANIVFRINGQDLVIPMGQSTTGLWGTATYCYPNSEVALGFSGSEYITVPSNALINQDDSFTFESMVNINSGTFSCNSIGGTKTNLPTTAGGWSVFVNTWNTNDGKIIVESQNGVWSSTNNNILTPNKWHHLAVVVNGVSSVTVYLDGVVVPGAISGGGSLTNITTSNPFVIGALVGPSYHFNGKLDKVRFWSNPLTQTQVQDAIGTTLTGSEAGLVLDFEFNEGTPNANNTAISSTLTSIAGGITGSMTNFSKNGTTDNWISPYQPISGAASTTGTATTTYTAPAGGTTTFASSNTAVGTINSSTGVFTPLTNGTTIISYTKTVGSCTYTSQMAVTVVVAQVATTQTTLSGFATCQGVASPTQTTSVSGSGLGSNVITLTAPSGFEISTTAGSGYASTLTLTPSSGTVNATTIYVRLTGATAGSYSGNLTIASTGATTQNLALSGTVNPNPVLSITSPAAVCSPATVDLTAAAVTSGSTNVSTLAYYTDAAASASLASPSAVTISGTYYFKATSAAGCTDIQPVTVTVNDPISAVALAVNDMPCGSSATGSATITLTGGAAPFTYSWTKNGVAFTATPVAAPTNLSSGTYIVTVTDACGSATSNSVTLTNSPSLNLLSATLGANALCFGGNGSIVGVIQGGTAPRTLTATNTANNTLVYTSSVPTGSPAAGQFQFTLSVPAGTYTVSASDGVSSCVATFSTPITVTSPAAISASTAKTDVCFGGINGTITITATGGTGTLTYSIDGGTTYQSSNTFTGLSANTYSVVVKDNNGCTTTPASVIINQAGSALSLAIASVTNISCYNQPTGAVNLTATGGYSSAYTYSWSGPSSFTATTEDLSAIYAGVYNVTVTDAGGCTATSTATVTQPAAFTATAVATNITCNGLNNGEIQITVAGGTTPFSYAWTGPSSFTAISEDLTSLAPGIYNLTITDANTCSVNATATITEPSLLAATNVVTDVSCNGASTGAINQTVTGGTTPYSFAWTGPNSFTATTEDLSGRPAGTYSVTVTDANSCTASATLTIAEPIALNAVISSLTNNTCFGESNGSATALGSGGTGTLIYSWNTSPVQTGATATNLPAGSYTVTITDANSCTATANINVTQPTAITASVSSVNVSCNGGTNGVITVNNSAGGTAPYQYSIDGGTTWQSSNTFSGLTAGTYNVQIKDNGGTPGTPATPATISTTVTQSYNGRNMTYSNVNINSSGNSVVVAPGSSVAISYNYSMAYGSLTCPGCVTQSYIGVGGTSTNIQCISPITSTTNGLFNGTFTAPTTPGIYYISQSWSFEFSCQPSWYPAPNNASNAIGVIVVTANSGCIKDLDGVTNTVITQPSVLTASAVGTNILCNGASTGTVTASATGGTAPYTYSIDGSTFAASASFTGLLSGTYTVTVKDANNCTATATVTLTQPASALSAADDGISPASCSNISDGAIPITATGGTAPYTYSWTGPNSFTSTSEDQFYNLAAGTYSVVVTDNNACQFTLSNLVVAAPAPVILALVNATNATCYQGTDGSIDISATGGTTPYGYQWAKDGVNYATSQDLTNLSSGTYTLTFTDGNFCQQTLADVVITDGVQLTASVAADATVVCSGDDVTFTITGTAGNIVTYNINGGSNTTATITSGGTATVTVNGATVAQTISLVSVQSGICSDPVSGTATTTINALPTANAGTDQTVCAGVSVTLSGSGTGTYSWDNSITDGVAFTAINATNSTINTVYTLTVTDGNGCQNTDQVTVTVTATPDVTAIDNQLYCNNGVAPVTQITSNTSIAGTSYSWTNSNTAIGLAASGNGDVPSFTATNSGTTPITATITVTPSVSTGSAITLANNTTYISNPQVGQIYGVTLSGTLNGSVWGSGTYTSDSDLGTAAVHAGLLTNGQTGTVYVQITPGASSYSSTTANGVTTLSYSSYVSSYVFVNAPSASTCTGTPITYTITVQPTPTVDQEPNVVYCGGVMQNPVIFTGSTANTQYAWVSDNNVGFFNGPGIANPSLGGGYVIDQPTQVVATLQVTPQIVSVSPSLTCSGSVMIFTVTQNPTPQVNAISNQALCAGSSTTAVNFTNISGTVAGATYAWTNSNTAIGLSASGTGNIQSFVATNSGSTLETATIDVTPSLNGCSGTTESFTISVSPTPTVNSIANQTLCAGSTTTAVVPAGAVNGTTYNWTNSNTAIGLSASGTGTIPSITATNTGTTSISSTITVTPSTGGLSGTVFGEVNENGTLNLNAPAGTFFTGVQFASFGTPTGTLGNYSIGSCHANNSTTVVSNLALGQTSVSIYANGSLFGDPCPGTGKSLAVVLTYGTGQPSCVGSPTSFTISVDPTPVISNKTETICSGSAFTATTGGSDLVPAGTQYTWTVAPNSNVTGASNQTTSVATISQTLTNTTNTVQSVIYTVTPATSPISIASPKTNNIWNRLVTYTGVSLNGQGNSVTVTPGSNVSITYGYSVVWNGSVFCPGCVVQSYIGIGGTNTTVQCVNPVTNGTNGTFNGTFTAPSTPGIYYLTQSGTLDYVCQPQFFSNSPSTAIAVIYVGTSAPSSCTGAPFTVTVNVDPKPSITTQSTTICSGDIFSVSPTNGSGNIVPAGTTYSWSAPGAVAGITGLASGTAQSSISGTLTNSTSAPINVTYVVTPTSGPCTGVPFNVVVTVNPSPAITNMTSTICSATSFTAAPINGTNGIVPAGTTYTWTVFDNPNITGESNVSNASNDISQTLTNSSNTVQIVSYTVTPTFASCAGTLFAVDVTVNPIPAVANKFVTICSGSAFSVLPTNGSDLVPVGTTYTWTVASNTNISGQSNQAVAQSSIAQTLVNNTDVVQTIDYTVTPSFNGCTGTPFTVTVIVNPTPSILSQVTSACSGVAVTLAPANGGGNVVPTGTTYTWTVVDNPNVVGETNANTAQNSIVQTLVNAYTSAQQVVYTVTPSFNGCVGTPFTYTVTVSTPVTVAALTGATNVCLGSTTQLASATSGGVWTSSNTAVATVSSTGVVSGLTTGSTTISYTVTNSVGCTGVVTANVNVNALPVATITPSGATTFCQGSSVTLTASAGASYLWSNGLQTQAITVNTAGNYSVQVFNAAGCVTTSSAVAVVVNALPTATITASGSTTFCQGGSVTLTASAGSTYLWSNGATTQSITATTSGCYSVTVTNANGCSATSACTQVTVNALPVATISSLNGNSFCQGGSVTLVSTPGSIYAWSNGLQTQSINVTASANLTVTVTNANGCFATSAPFAVTMNALPTAVITAGGPTTFCQGGSVVLTATGGTSYTWSNSTSTSNTLTVSTPGVYTVTATNANGCTATSAPVTVTVNALPVVAAIAGANDVCVGSTSILTNATPSGVWTSSNAAVATVSATGTVTGVTAGSATINYTVTNASGCVTTTSMLVNVNAVPVNIPIGGPNTVCVGATITNFATPGGVWSSSNVSVATVAQNGIITGVGAGTATISYTITNAAGCSNTVTKVVTVNALPTVAVAANGPLTFCQGGSVTLTASGGTSYAWDNSTITTPARTITTSGTYTVTVTNANGCFATSAPVVVNVLALPNAAIASTGSTICLGNTVTLTASGGVSYAWSNGAQTAATTVNNSNTYTVTVTGANGCTNTASNVVTVNANPAVVTTANGPLTFCQGGSVTLNATGAASYIWSNGTLGSSNIITQSGTYYVQGTNAAGCTSNSAVVTVTVLPTPVVAALTGSNTVCEASTITLSSATPGGVWTSSNGFVATVNNSGVVTGMNAGTTTITYTLSNGACNSSVSASVTVLNSPATPVITAAGPTTVCPGETVTLFSSNAPNYQWNSGQQTNGIVVTQSGTYDITVTGSNGCAVTSLPITVTIGDDVAPIIVAPLNVNVNPNLGCTAVGVALGTPVVSDNCTVASVTNNAPGLFPIGTTTVTWTVTDGAGNTATATQLVNVVDQIAPEATAPANVTVNTNNFCDATGVNLGTPEATDNCTIASIVNDAPASFPIGTTVVTWTITDATGNFTTVTQNVTVVDTEAPVVVLQSAAVQLDANGVGVLTFAAIDNGSSDNCGIAEVTIDQTTFDCGQVGFNTVTVTITDNSGNQSEAQVIINVIASDACGGADVAGPQVPDAFTPNGNSINDTWVIPGLEGYNTKEMAVYSRYGTLVYYSGAYANDWDGTLMGNGVAVPDGTYYYTLTLDGGKQLSGYVYINRVKQ
jgi:gliding motility-associated-like protein